MPTQKHYRDLVVDDALRRVTEYLSFHSGVLRTRLSRKDVDTLRGIVERAVDKGRQIHGVLCGNCGRTYTAPDEESQHGWNVCQVNSTKRK